MTNKGTLADELQLAIQHHRAGRIQQAEQIYRKILSVEPANAGGNFHLGLLASQVGKFDLAIMLFSNALNNNKHNSLFYYHLGFALLMHGKRDDALQSFRNALKIKPDYVEVHNIIGIDLIRQGDLEGATLSFKKALEINPDNIHSLNNLGLVFIEQGKRDEAILSFKRALEINPDFAEANNNLGGLLNAQGKFDEAAKVLKHAIEIKPDYIEAYCNLGNVLKEKGDLDEAIASFDKAIAINPNHVVAHSGLGNVYLKQSSLDKAVFSYQKSLSLNPKYAEAYCNLGTVFVLQDKLVAADQAFRRAISIDPDNALAYRQFAYLHNQKFNKPIYFKGHEYLKKVKKLLPKERKVPEKSIHLHIALGEMYDNCKLYNEAFHHFQQANLLKYKHMNFNFSEIVNQTEKIINTFSSDIFSSNDIVGSNSSRPVFITGLPRSGKTLVERLLAVHPHFFGCGEQGEIQRLIHQEIPKRIRKKVTYPSFLKYLDRQTALEIADEYEKYLVSIAGQSPQRVSNTFPYSYMLIGILVLFFPRAKIIYCRRKPLDNCLAIYFKDFDKGNEYAYNLNEIGLYYRQCEKLINHWQKILAPKIYVIQFEELLNNPTDEILKLVDFLELNTDDHFLKKLKKILSREHSPLDPKHPRGADWSINYRKFLAPLEESFNNT